MQHDPVATFFGGYDQVGSLRRSRFDGPPLHVSRNTLAIGIAAMALLAFVAADVSALENPPVVVKVTSVEWYALGFVIASSGGFNVRASQTIALSETCEGICLPVVGVSVASPFTLVRDTIVDQPVQWVNLTVRAPATSYDGNLSVTLALP